MGQSFYKQPVVPAGVSVPISVLDSHYVIMNDMPAANEPIVGYVHQKADEHRSGFSLTI